VASTRLNGRFLDRDVERRRLERAWVAARRGQPQLVIVWGRRRVGKTFLLSHFIQKKRAVFFGATQQAEGVELGRLAEAVRRDLGDRVADLAGGGFATWEAALRFFAALAAAKPLVVVLDEVPYLARSTPGLPSIVQAVWDHLPRKTKLLLILTGSAVGTIEAMLGAGGALRGRPTDTLRLDPLDPWNARRFLPRLDPVRFLEAYAACGGYPLHLAAWDPSASTERNLEQLAGAAGGLLLEEADGILSEELPESGGYARILAAIGRGRTRYAEIAGDAGQRVEYPLDVLVRAGFVAKVAPVGAPRAARAIYAIGDTYLAFWFRVLYTDLALIEGGQGAAVLRRARPRWQTHIGQVFEDVARAHAQRLVARGDLPSDLVVGRWWAASGEPCEIDVLGLRGGHTALLGEARWQAEPLGLRDLEQLRRKAARVPDPVAAPIHALWGRVGITEEARRAGAKGFDVDAMIEE
jgi:AAA+ ATPase superfamily predicted ATPase